MSLANKQKLESKSLICDDETLAAQKKSASKTEADFSMRKHESLEARVASARDYVVLLFLRQVDEANRIS